MDFLFDAFAWLYAAIFRLIMEFLAGPIVILTLCLTVVAFLYGIALPVNLFLWVAKKWRGR